jgi:hypothetical protein
MSLLINHQGKGEAKDAWPERKNSANYFLKGSG